MAKGGRDGEQGSFGNPLNRGAPPQMGTIASSAMPNPGGIGGTAKGAAPISYYKNQADIPQGKTGFVRPNEQGIGVNRVMGVAPAPVQRQPNLRDQFARMALKASMPMHFGGGSVGQRYRAYNNR